MSIAASVSSAVWHSWCFGCRSGQVFGVPANPCRNVKSLGVFDRRRRRSSRRSATELGKLRAGLGGSSWPMPAATCPASTSTSASAPGFIVTSRANLPAHYRESNFFLPSGSMGRRGLDGPQRSSYQVPPPGSLPSLNLKAGHNRLGCGILNWAKNALRMQADLFGTLGPATPESCGVRSRCSFSRTTRAPAGGQVSPGKRQQCTAHLPAVANF